MQKEQKKSDDPMISHLKSDPSLHLSPTLSLSEFPLSLSSLLSSEFGEMERLPVEVSLKIFSLLDHQNLATAQLVCRKWRILASADSLWCNLFRERWGLDRAMFFAPEGSKLWKDVYVVQDRGDRVGLGLKIIREGDDYYLVHQGEIQRHLGTRRPETGEIYHSSSTLREEEFSNGEEPCSGILDKILFFIGDLESASVHAKRSRVV